MSIKSILLGFGLFFILAVATAQEKGILSVQYLYSSPLQIDANHRVKAAYLRTDRFMSVGAFYQKGISRSLSYQIGLRYSFGEFGLEDFYTDPLGCYSPIYEDFKAVSLSLNGYWHFLRFFSVFSGPFLEVHMNNKYMYSQNGLGLEAGFQVDIPIKRFGIKLGYFVRKHAVSPGYLFEQKDTLEEEGLVLGISFSLDKK